MMETTTQPIARLVVMTKVQLIVLADDLMIERDTLRAELSATVEQRDTLLKALKDVIANPIIGATADQMRSTQLVTAHIMATGKAIDAIASVEGGA